MLFRRLHAPSCSYCRFGSSIGGGEIACTKRGITSEGGYCKKFRYDPLKREPERPEKPVIPVMSQELSIEFDTNRGAELEEKLNAAFGVRTPAEVTPEASEEPPPEPPPGSEESDVTKDVIPD